MENRRNNPKGKSIANRILPIVLFFCMTGIVNADTATEKILLRNEAILVETQYQRGEITEADALERLDAIEKRARELKNIPKPVPVEIPQENPRKPPRAEEMVATSLIRRAVLPRLSLGEMVWGILRPIIHGIVLIGTPIVLLTIGVACYVLFGTFSELFRRRRSGNRENHYPGRPPPPPVTARSIQRNPNPSPRPLPRPQPRLIPDYPHSGEVPDHLT